MLKGPFIRAKHMQADLATCTGSLNSRHVTVTQYRAYLNEAWTFKITLEHALTGMLTVVEATTAANCGLSYDNSGCQHRLTLVRQSMAHVRSLHFTGFNTCCGLHKGQSMGCQLSGQCIGPLSWHSCRLSQMGHWFASELLPLWVWWLQHSGKWNCQRDLCWHCLQMSWCACWKELEEFNTCRGNKLC